MPRSLPRLLIGLAVLVLTVTACGAPDGAGQAGGTPTPSPQPSPPGAVHADAIWFQVLAVSQEGTEIGAVDLVTDAQALADLWPREGFAGRPQPVDFSEQVVVVVVRPENGCPDDLVEARVADGVLTTTFLEPPAGCIDPLIPTAYAIAFHRADLPGRVTVRFDAHEGLGGDIAATFSLPSYDGPPAPAPSPPPRRMDDETLDAVFADHPVQRCDELPDPRDGALGGGPSPLQSQLTDEPGDIQDAYAAEHADTFGWLLLDSNADQLVVGVTDDVEGHEQRLAERHPDVPIRVELTPHSQRDLLAAQEAVMPLHESGVVVSSGPFAFLELGVVDPARGDLDAIAEAVEDPAMVCVDPVLSGLGGATDRSASSG